MHIYMYAVWFQKLYLFISLPLPVAEDDGAMKMQKLLDFKLSGYVLVVWVEKK